MNTLACDPREYAWRCFYHLEILAVPSGSDHDIPRAKTRKRFEDVPAGAVSADPTAVATPPTAPENASAPPSDTAEAPAPGGLDAPPAGVHMPSENTMSGGIVVAGQNTFIGASGVSSAENTLSGGMGFDALPKRVTRMPFAANTIGVGAPAEGTLSGGLGYTPAAPNAAGPVQIRSLQTLTRGRKFDDFSAPAQPRPTPAERRPAAVAPVIDDASVWKVGDTIEGKYEVTAIAGQGGMGVVYKIRHREWNIEMAVKTPLPALVKDAAAKARFLREAQIWVDLGLHPNIVQCWYVRELDGLPRVFVDYLAGGSLKDWFVGKRVGPGHWQLIIDLIVQACDGLGYAHDRGVVHRDIKPGNMLMSADGRLCITDFGLVKLAGVDDIQSSEDDAHSATPDLPGADLTRTGLSLGTPQYGAPEQWGQARHVDARADIYALGLTLYELCCGRRPFDESGKGEPAQVIIARHLTSRPPDPRSFYKDLPAPLADLALKCLAKNPAARPQSLAEVREALADAHQAIFGMPLERMAPEIAESRASGLNNRAVSMWDLGQPAQAELAWKEALALDPRHAESLYNSSLIEMRTGRIADLEAQTRLREAAKSQRRALLFLGHVQLETCDAEGAEHSYREALADPALATDAVAWRALGHATLALDRFEDAEAAYAKALAIMPRDEATLAGAAQARMGSRAINGRIGYPHLKCLGTIADRVGSARAVAIAVDGRSVYADGPSNTISQFELPSGRQMINFRGPTKQVLSVTPTPNGRFLLGGGEDSILRMWSLDSTYMIDNFYGKGHVGSIVSIAVSPDSSAAATCGNDKSVRLWELQTGTLIRTIWAHEDAACAVAFAPNGQAVASAGNDGTIRFWEIPSGNSFAVLRNRLTAVRALVFSTDGRYLFSGGCDGRILKWDCAGLPLGQRDACQIEFNGHRGTVNALAMVPNTPFLISAGDDNTVRIWDTATGLCLRTFTGHEGVVNAVAVTPDGSIALSGANENLGRPLRLWNLELDRFKLQRGDADPYAAGLYVCRVESQDSSQSASRQFKQHIRDAVLAFEYAQYAASYVALKKARAVEGYERDPMALELNAKLSQKLPLKSIAAVYLQSEIEGRHTAGFKAVAFAAQGALAISAGRNDKSIGAWDLASGAFLQTLEGHKQSVEALAVNSEGTLVLSASSDYSVGVWDVATGLMKSNLQGHRGEINAVAISRDNRQAASASSDGTLKLWDITSGKCVKTFENEHSAEPLCAVKFMPDGRSLIVGARDGAVALWSIVLGKRVREFPGHFGAILDLAVFPDKPQFLTGGEDKTLRLWNADNGQNIWLVRDGKSRFNAIALSPDSRFVFSGGLEGANTSVNIWEVSTGKLTQSVCPHAKGIAALTLSADGCKMLTGSEDKFLRVWDLEWELVMSAAASAPSVQIRRPLNTAASGILPLAGFVKRDPPKPPADASLAPTDDSKKSRPSIFLDGRGKPKAP